MRLWRVCAIALFLPALAVTVAQPEEIYSDPGLRPGAPQHRPGLHPLRLISRSKAVLVPLHTLHALPQGKRLEEGASRDTSTTGPLARSRRFFFAYAIWLCFGWTGFHHIYLGRNRAALFSALTFGGFGIGWVLDAFQIPRWIRELEKVDLAHNSEPQLLWNREAADVPTNSTSAFECTRYDRSAAIPVASRHLTPRDCFRCVARMCTRFATCHWYMMHAARLLPDEASGVAPALLRAGGTGVALWLTAAACDGPSLTGIALTTLVWIATWLLQAALGAPRAAGHGPLFVALIANEWLPRLAPRLSRASAPRHPKRTRLLCVVVVLIVVASWVTAACCALMRRQVGVMLDGKLRTANGLSLLRAALCGLHPSRIVSALRLKCEPICIKNNLEQLMGTTFDNFCILPNRINRCFDWDLSGDRWSRVGLSEVEAYHVLGVMAGASAAQIKSAHRRLSLELHPDKMAGWVDSTDALEASKRFMKAQRAYETIMQAHASKDASPWVWRRASSSSKRT